MVELVDTQDLKSCALNRRAGSIPAPSTKAKLRFGFCCLYTEITPLFPMHLFSEQF